MPSNPTRTAGGDPKPHPTVVSHEGRVNRKRRLDEVADNWVELQSQPSSLRPAANLSESQADPSRVHVTDDPTKRKLAFVDPSLVIFEPRDSGPNLLETPDQQVDFYTVNTDPCRAPGTYLMKVSATDASIDAMQNTLAELLKYHNADSATLHFELETPQVTEMHRREIREAIARATMAASNDRGRASTEPGPVQMFQPDVQECNEHRGDVEIDQQTVEPMVSDVLDADKLAVKQRRPPA